MEIRRCFKRVIKNKVSRIDVKKLKKKGFRTEVARDFRDKLDNLEDPEQSQINDGISEAQEKRIGKIKAKKKNSWITEEALYKMEERRLAKGNWDAYRMKNKEVRRLCRKAKEKFY